MMMKEFAGAFLDVFKQVESDKPKSGPKITEMETESEEEVESENEEVEPKPTKTVEELAETD